MIGDEFRWYCTVAGDLTCGNVYSPNLGVKHLKHIHTQTVKHLKHLNPLGGYQGHARPQAMLCGSDVLCCAMLICYVWIGIYIYINIYIHIHTYLCYIHG